MASDRLLGWGLAARLVTLLVVMAGTAFVLVQPDLAATKLVALAVTAMLVSGLVHHVRRTNRELARFLDALTFADVSQSFSSLEPGLAQDELAAALNAAMTRVRQSRAEVVAEARFFRALVEHVPIPLLSVDDGERVELLNSAARRLFGNVEVASLAGLSAFGERLVRDLRGEVPGGRRLTEMTVEGTRQTMTLAVAELGVAERRQRIVILQNIQGALDANELTVWRELVRVLTHEIMNSLTPLTSLAKTAVEAVGRAGPGPELDDARVAVGTLERRADRLMHFVQSYRKLTKLPPPRPRAFAVAPFVTDVTRLFRAEWPEARVALEPVVEPGSLELFGDAEQLEQAVLNLLNNAAQAAVDGAGPAARVWLSARANRRGGATLEVADNGPGVPAAIRDSIFLPFFTTKPAGTGVGLSLTRQIALAHGAAISVEDREGGGARFRLTFGAI
jgi:two-component system nitrogen regulation sensor histidine kinase NtrY